MKNVLLVVALVLVGCQSARVLSSDGARQIAQCSGTDILTCVRAACPNGFDVVVDSPDNSIPDIIKCKP